jgi:type I restriction enzyme S subunit
MEVIGDHQGSDVGELPAGWRIVPLGRLVASVEYGSSAKSRPSGEVPVLRMGNLQDGKVVWDDLVYTDSKAEIGKYFLTPGDVLFNRTNTIDLVGKTSLYLGERPAIFAGYLIRIIVEKSKLDARYLNYVLNTRASKRYSAKVLSVAVGQANINGQKLKTYPIPLPPTRAEQEAIAEALSDVDVLIESLEQLLAKKRQIKQGAMHELLTGKKRLPGSRGEWSIRSLGEIGECVAGLTYAPSDVRSDGLLVLRASNVSEGGIRFEDNVYVQMEVPQRVFVKPGDILICVRNGSRDLIGKCAKIDGRAEGMVFGAFMAVFRTPFADFVYHQFQSVNIKRQINEHLGATINQITNRSLRAFVIPFPHDAAERASIAEVLSGMDAEIAMLEAKVAKARQIKQGMMQELLTGRIRLI